MDDCHFEQHHKIENKKKTKVWFLYYLFIYLFIYKIYLFIFFVNFVL